MSNEEWVAFRRYYEDDTVAFIVMTPSIVGDLQEKSGNLLINIIQLRQPTEEGLLSPEEVDDFQAFDNALYERASQLGLTYAGRRTAGGGVYTYLYGNLASNDLDGVAKELGRLCSYESTWAIEPDPVLGRFWNDLYPVQSEWRAISNDQVLNDFVAQDDNTGAKRKVDHWAFFSSAKVAKRFGKLLADQGIDSTDISEVDGEDLTWSVKFSQIANPHSEDFLSFTILLDSEAAQLEGRYDGWEAEIIKNS